MCQCSVTCYKLCKVLAGRPEYLAIWHVHLQFWIHLAWSGPDSIPDHNISLDYAKNGLALKAQLSLLTMCDACHSNSVGFRCASEDVSSEGIDAHLYCMPVRRAYCCTRVSGFRGSELRCTTAGFTSAINQSSLSSLKSKLLTPAWVVGGFLHELFKTFWIWCERLLSSRWELMQVCLDDQIPWSSMMSYNWIELRHILAGWTMWLDSRDVRVYHCLSLHMSSHVMLAHADVHRLTCFMHWCDIKSAKRCCVHMDTHM